MCAYTFLWFDGLGERAGFHGKLLAEILQEMLRSPEPSASFHDLPPCAQVCQHPTHHLGLRSEDTSSLKTPVKLELPVTSSSLDSTSPSCMPPSCWSLCYSYSPLISPVDKELLQVRNQVGLTYSHYISERCRPGTGTQCVEWWTSLPKRKIEKGWEKIHDFERLFPKLI